jgi:hypothetical protein
MFDFARWSPIAWIGAYSNAIDFKLRGALPMKMGRADLDIVQERSFSARNARVSLSG